VKSSFLLGFLESVREVSARFKEPESKERKLRRWSKQTKNPLSWFWSIDKGFTGKPRQEN